MEFICKEIIIGSRVGIWLKVIIESEVVVRARKTHIFVCVSLAIAISISGATILFWKIPYHNRDRRCE